MAKKALKTIKHARIGADYGRNVRQLWKYKVEPKPNFDPAKDTPGFYEDIVLRGVQNPIVVSELSPDRKAFYAKKFGWDIDFLVLQGHRRYMATCIARESNPDLFQTLDCVVYTGLSEKEEIQLMCDHAGVEPLNEYEEFQAVERLFGTGLSQEQIGLHVGRKRAWVQDRIYILDLCNFLPGFRDSYAKSFEPEVKPYTDFTPITMKDVDAMHKAYNDDIKSGLTSDNPNSKTAALWNALREQTGPGEPTKKSMTRKEMDKRAGIIKGCEALEIAHGFYNGDGRNLQDAVDIYKTLTALAAMVPDLQSENASLKAQIEDLTRVVAELNAEIATLKATPAPASK